jgi:hypothetical protein
VYCIVDQIPLEMTSYNSMAYMNALEVTIEEI